MVEPQPTKKPEWNTGGSNRTEPASGEKASGWVIDDQPPSSYFNWLQYYTYAWLEWLNERFYKGSLEIDLTVAALQPDTSGDGGDLELLGGDANTSGLGGYVKAQAGTGVSGFGGDASLYAGDGSAGGGKAWMAGGDATTSGAGGDISISGGVGIGSEGGDVTITAGPSDTDGGDLTLAGGGNTVSGGGGTSAMYGGSAASGIGGLAVVGGGNCSGTGTGGIGRLYGGTCAVGAGGAVDINGGDSSSGAGGDVTIDGGDGVNAEGGDIIVTAGPSNTDGGDITITGGQSTAVGGGGDSNVSGGDATTGTAGSAYLNGGDVSILGAGGLARVRGGDSGGANQNAGNAELSSGTSRGTGYGQATIKVAEAGVAGTGQNTPATYILCNGSNKRINVSRHIIIDGTSDAAKGAIRLVPDAKPTGPSAGDIYSDSSADQLRYYDGTLYRGLSANVYALDTVSLAVDDTTATEKTFQLSGPVDLKYVIPAGYLDVGSVVRMRATFIRGGTPTDEPGFNIRLGSYSGITGGVIAQVVPNNSGSTLDEFSLEAEFVVNTASASGTVVTVSRAVATPSATTWSTDFTSIYAGGIGSIDFTGALDLYPTVVWNATGAGAQTMGCRQFSVDIL